MVDGVLSVTLAPEHAVATDEVLTQVHLGAALLEAAAVFVIVQTHLRQEDTGHLRALTNEVQNASDLMSHMNQKSKTER